MRPILNSGDVPIEAITRVPDGVHQVPLHQVPMRDIAAQASRVLDALTALTVQMGCHGSGQRRSRPASPTHAEDSCVALREAVAGLKHVLRIAEESGGALLTPGVLLGRSSARAGTG